MAEVNLPIIIGAAVIDSINPCAFGVLIFLLAYLSKTAGKGGKLLLHGMTYIFAVLLTGAADRIKTYVGRISGSIFSAFTLGVFVALVELPCTGAVYLAILSMMALSGITTLNIELLLLYNIIFV